MGTAGKRAFSLDSLWLYALAAGAVGVTGWLVWRSPLVSSASLTSTTTAASRPNAPAAALLPEASARPQSDLERLMSMSTSQPAPVAARPAPMVNLTGAAGAAGSTDAKHGELVIVGKSGVTRVMTKPPAENTNASGATSGPPLAGGKTAAPAKPSGPRVFEPETSKTPDPARPGEDQPKYYNYDTAERNRANSGGLPTYNDPRDVRSR
jgi:hypothetical protein